MAFEIFGVQPTDDGTIFSTQSAGGRASKKSARGVIARHSGPGGRSEILGEAGERIQGIAVRDDRTLYAVTAKGRLLHNEAGDLKAKNLKLPDLLRVLALADGELVVVGDHGTVARGSVQHGFTAKMFAEGQSASCVHGVSASASGTLVAVGAPGVLINEGAEWFVARKAEARTLLIGVHVLADDDVIIAGEPAILLRGDPRAEMRPIEVPEGVKKLKAVCEFQGSVYVAAGSDGILRLDGDRLISVNTSVAAYHLGSSKALLCAAGMGFMACFDGKSWTATHEDTPIT